MAITTFSGPVRSLGGFVESGLNNAIDATAASRWWCSSFNRASPSQPRAPGVLPATVGSPGPAGKALTVSADCGPFSLPLINAVNPGANAAAGQGQGGASDPNQTSNLGMQFRFTVLADLTTDLIINTGALTDVIFGTINFCDDANDAGVAAFFHTPGTANSVTFNGASQGGDAGSTFTLTAVGAAAWKLEGVSVFPTASTPATPFSTRV